MSDLPENLRVRLVATIQGIYDEGGIEGVVDWVMGGIDADQGLRQAICGVLNEQYGCNAEPSEPLVVAVEAYLREHDARTRQRIEAIRSPYETWQPQGRVLDAVLEALGGEG